MMVDIRTELRIKDLINRLHVACSKYRFQATDEAQFQDQLAGVLAAEGFVCDREVPDGGNRYDISIRQDGVHVVLELKVAGSVAAVERQAQRYAMMIDVDAVVVVTTSNRLAHKLDRGSLPGPARDPQPGDGMLRKPFDKIVVRCM